MNKCPICDEEPTVFTVNLAGPGALKTAAWVAECEGSELEGDSFIEHSVAVYGNTKEEAEGRWQIMAEKT